MCTIIVGAERAHGHSEHLGVGRQKASLQWRHGRHSQVSPNPNLLDPQHCHANMDATIDIPINIIERC
jgi:hypothetical protein